MPRTKTPAKPRAEAGKTRKTSKARKAPASKRVKKEDSDEETSDAPSDAPSEASDAALEYRNSIVAVRCFPLGEVPFLWTAPTIEGIKITGTPFDKLEITVESDELLKEFTDEHGWKLKDRTLTHPLLGGRWTDYVNFQVPAPNHFKKKGPTGFLPKYGPEILEEAIKLAFKPPEYVPPPMQRKRVTGNMIPQVYQQKGTQDFLEDTFAWTMSADYICMAVFDGHGGPYVAYELHKQFLDMFQKYTKNSSPPKIMMQRVFEYAHFMTKQYSCTFDPNKPFKGQEEQATILERGLAGAVGVVCIYDKAEQRSHIGWVGDCYAATMRRTGNSKKPVEIHRVTKDHVVDAAETARIMLAGGFVCDGRAMGTLQPTRKVGGAAYTALEPAFDKAVGPRMDYLVYALHENDLALFVASDGLYPNVREWPPVQTPQNANELFEIMGKKQSDWGYRDDATMVSLFLV